MKDNLIAEVLIVIDGDPELRSKLAAAPEAIVMPLAKDHQKHYLAISAAITQVAATRQTVASFCSRVVTLLALADSFEGLEGVEIILRTEATRIMRLGVTSQALNRASQLGPLDLETGIPSPGIQCFLYKPW